VSVDSRVATGTVISVSIVFLIENTQIKYFFSSSEPSLSKKYSGTLQPKSTCDASDITGKETTRLRNKNRHKYFNFFINKLLGILLSKYLYIIMGWK
jgi:hypothetical protein